MALLQLRLSRFFVAPDIPLPGLLLVFAASIGVSSVDGGAHVPLPQRMLAGPSSLHCVSSLVHFVLALPYWGLT